MIMCCVKFMFFYVNFCDNFYDFVKFYKLSITAIFFLDAVLHFGKLEGKKFTFKIFNYNFWKIIYGVNLLKIHNNYLQ